jgi:hypothetical protein
MKTLILSLIICSLGVAPAAFGQDGSSLNQAIASLNARAKTPADQKLLLNAVSQQTKVPEKTLQAHMTATRLNYGELLTAESIAVGIGKNVNVVLAMKHGKGWADLSRELRIDPTSIVNRLQSAEKTVQAGQGNKKQAGTMMKKPAGLSSTPAPSAPPMSGRY